jgi:uncharacterized membrane protein YgaE (UPF0421/DUF939 family)
MSSINGTKKRKIRHLSNTQLNAAGRNDRTWASAAVLRTLPTTNTETNYNRTLRNQHNNHKRYKKLSNMLNTIPNNSHKRNAILTEMETLEKRNAWMEPPPLPNRQKPSNTAHHLINSIHHKIKHMARKPGSGTFIRRNHRKPVTTRRIPK